MLQDKFTTVQPGNTQRPPASRAAHPLVGLAIAVLSLVITASIFGMFSLPFTVLLGMTLVAWLAAENGGNDVAKGVAPLVAGKFTSERGALLYGTLATIVGSVLSVTLADKVLKLFTSGLIAENFAITVPMTLAIATGASLWVALATRFSLPVSTTHAIVGSIVSVGLIAFGTQGILWDGITKKVVMPLLFSPFVGLGLTYGVTLLLSRVNLPESASKPITWLTTGGICLVRSMNDTPKIAAISFFLLKATGANTENLIPLLVLVAVAMSLGSYIKGMPILRLLAHKVTCLNCTSCLTSSGTAVSLIYAASVNGMPVSTTHVSTTSIIGGGLATGSNPNWAVVRDMALSWLVTLPLAGAIAGLAYLITLL